MVYNGYYKVMSNIPKMGQLPTPDQCPSNTYLVLPVIIYWGPSVIPNCHGKNSRDPDTSKRYRPYALVQLQHLQEMWDSPDAINPKITIFMGAFQTIPLNGRFMIGFPTLYINYAQLRV